MSTQNTPAHDALNANMKPHMPSNDMKALLAPYAAATTAMVEERMLKFRV